MTDLSSWTAYFQDFGQFFNGFLFTLALAIGSFILAMVLGIFFELCQPANVQFLRILARIFVEFLPKHSSLGTVCYRFLWSTSYQ